MAIKTVGVVGTGVIGASWTALFLSRGLKVIVSDPGAGAKEKLFQYLRNAWPVLQSAESIDSSLSRCHFVGASLGDSYKEVDFVQENAPERLDLKTNLLAEIDSLTRPDVVIASSSSGMPSSSFIGKCQHNPGRILIGHPFNPPHLMPLVEVVPHAKTSTSAIEAAMSFYKLANKRPILIKQEVPGHVANRLQAALCNEAYSLVARDVVSAEDLDTCITASLGPRYTVTGPMMANAMGGGGGSQGFRHMLEHLGPAVQAWLEDMRAHQFEYTPENYDKLGASISEEMKNKDTEQLERERDEQLIELLSLQQKHIS